MKKIWLKCCMLLASLGLLSSSIVEGGVTEQTISSRQIEEGRIHYGEKKAKSRKSSNAHRLSKYLASNTGRIPSTTAATRGYDPAASFQDLLKVDTPTTLDGTTNGECGESKMKVEIFFFTDENSNEDNELYLYDINTPPRDFVWNFPVGSFTVYDTGPDNSNSQEHAGADYYFATCVDDSKCYQLDFEDAYGDFNVEDPLAELYVFVDDMEVMKLSPTKWSFMITPLPDYRPWGWFVNFGRNCNIETTPEAPTRIDDTTFDDGSCAESEMLIEMAFITDKYSLIDNEVYLYDIKKSDGEDDYIWNFPLGSFPINGTPDTIDYYFATCVDTNGCYSFDFVDVFGDFTSAALSVVVDGVDKMILESSLSGDISPPPDFEDDPPEWFVEFGDTCLQ